jgi:hypothetical protein
MREATMQTFEKLVPSAPHGRFAGIDRLYRPDDVLRLRGSLQIQHTLAEVGANRLWFVVDGPGEPQEYPYTRTIMKWSKATALRPIHHRRMARQWPMSLHHRAAMAQRPMPLQLLQVPLDQRRSAGVTARRAPAASTKSQMQTWLLRLPRSELPFDPPVRQSSLKLLYWQSRKACVN